jgi:hypothetical protein
LVAFHTNVFGVNVHVLAQGVERNDRQPGEVIPNPGILARARKAGHQHDLGAKPLVGRCIRVTTGVAEVKEPRVVRLERPGSG